jgi:hypothetical protein
VNTLALTLVIILAAAPVVPQSPPAAAADKTIHRERPTTVVVPEPLQRAFALMKQPGFHPELFDLFEVEPLPGLTLGAPSPAAMKTWQGVVIVIAATIAVLFVLAYLGLKDS